MRTVTIFAVLAFSAAAFGQVSTQAKSARDVECVNLVMSPKSVCTFADGTGEIITLSAGGSSIQHFANPEEWTNKRTELLEADAAQEEAESARLQAESARLEAESAQSQARMAQAQKQSAEALAKAEERAAQRERALAIHHKKECVAAGFQWDGPSHFCDLKDEGK